MKSGNYLFYCVPKKGRHIERDLQALIENYLSRGWIVTKRDPLTIYRGRAGYQVQNGCLVSV